MSHRLLMKWESLRLCRRRCSSLIFTEVDPDTPRGEPPSTLQRETGWTIVGDLAICREHGIGAATFYQWKQKFGGMDVSEAQRLRPLED